MKRSLLLLISAFYALTSFGWGQKGHDVVAYIAECNLTPKAYKKVVELLDGHSLVYYANWMDNASNTDAYRYTKTWHYANVDAGFTYETMKKNPKGDIVTAIEDIVAKLKSGELTAEETSTNLKFLIHLVGDIHAPMHAGRLSDIGGNKTYVTYFGKKTKLHSLWDTPMVEDIHRWSYTEWQQQLDKICPKETKKQIATGTAKDWLTESHHVATKIYEASSDESKKLSYDYQHQFAKTLEQRLLYGGVRLAMILNEIYK
jgi:hypothetical protein